MCQVPHKPLLSPPPCTQEGGDSKTLQFETAALAPAQPTAKPATPAAPEATPALFVSPSPSPFMAFLSALASASGLKSLAGRTVPFSCKKQKETKQVSGGPSSGGARPREEHAREGRLSPRAPNRAAWGERGGVKAQQTDPCPRAERGRETDPSQAAGQVLVLEKSGQAPAPGVSSVLVPLWPPQFLRILPCLQGASAS